MYCPAGSPSPIPAEVGSYTLGGSSSSTGVESSPCEAGYYCVSGVKNPCPAGTYGDSVGMSAVTQCQPCHAGYLCPAASFVGEATADPANRVTECGSVSVYCMEGSFVPELASEGHYTVGQTATTRTNETLCEAGCVVVVVVVVCVARFWGRSDSMIRPLIGVNEQPLLPCRCSHGM